MSIAGPLICVEAGSHFPTGWGNRVATGTVIPQNSGRLELLSGGSSYPASSREIHDIAMTWTPTATRADVIRLVARYLRLEFSIRSAAGRLVIDETRMPRKRSVAFDISAASDAEIWDALRTSNIRRAVYAKPTDPALEVQPDEFGNHARRVAPLAEVARIVKVRSTRTTGSGRSDARDWRATVAQKLGSIPQDEARALLTAERLRIALVTTRNRLEEARRIRERLRGGARGARTDRRKVDERISDLRSREQADDTRLQELVRSSSYRAGVRHLLNACTRTEEIESYLFGTV